MTNASTSVGLLGLALFAASACSQDPASDGSMDLQDDGDAATEMDATAPGNSALRAYCGDDYAAIEARIDALLAEMTLGEKVALMHGASTGPRDGAWITLGNEERGVPPLRMLDGPRGVGLTSGSATAFPVGMARGATWDPELERRVGEAIGREVRAKGASVLLAPMINLVSHPRWGRAQEAYGEDPVHVGALGVAFIEGAQQHVIASAKHFAANNIENTRFEVDVQLDERTLREVYLPHFRRAVQEGQVGSVMSAYNQVNGAYCSENVPLLRDILKGEWAFQGFVESDWFFGTHDTVRAAIGGLDIEMPSDNVFGDPLRAAVRDGEVDESLIDEAARRVLRATFCFRLDTDPPVRDADVIESAEHLDLALEVARRGIVLLVNEGTVLPVDRSVGPTIAVVGPLADVANLGDAGSSNVRPSSSITPLAGLMAAAGAATVVSVADDLEAEPDRQAVAAADVVLVFVGLTSDDEGEGLIGAGDRATMGLADGQVALIETAAELNESVVVVLEGGSAITMAGWLDQVEAVLMAWYPGQMGGQAIAEVVFGDVSPSGRLPLAFPVDEADLPPFDNVSSEVTYPRHHGYRHLDAEGIVPLFPFGFGLSYTSFELDELQLSTTVAEPNDVISVSVEVTNRGNRAAIETVQLYVSAAESSVDRPERELKGFAQATVAPGQTVRVTIPLDVASLAYWNVDADAFVVEPTRYVLAVGHSSYDTPLFADLEVR